MSFFRILFLLFLAIPLLEIYLLIQVGEVVGALTTVFLVVATAVLGVALLRWQGLMTLTKVKTTMAQGELPALPLIEGMMLLVAGALLLTPGFFTDAIGFAFLIPPLRQRLARAILIRGLFRGPAGFGSPFGPRPGYGPNKGSRNEPGEGPRIIDGDYERRDD